MTPSEIDKMIKDASGVISLTASSVALERILELEAEVERLKKFRHIDEWYEDAGSVLWYRFPMDEPPQVSDPRDCDWVEGYYKWWLPLPVINAEEPTQ